MEKKQGCYLVEVKYTSTYQYNVWGDSKADAIRTAREISNPLDNQDQDASKDFLWSTASARKQK